MPRRGSLLYRALIRKAALTVAGMACACAACAADVITYEEFGAAGDGKTDDMAAIVAAHAAANEKGLPVRAGDGKTYYIGGGALTADIRTDVDFGTASFVIDDRDVPVEKREAPVFRIQSAAAPVEVKGIASLASGQKNLGVGLPGPSLVEVEDDTVRQYIRYGLNQNRGRPKREVLFAAEDGTVDPSTPVIWDYGKVTRAIAHPLDVKTLVVRGGRFTTIANKAESRYTYFWRGFAVNRSNVRIEGVRHDVTGEGSHGAPYWGFVCVSHAANIMVSNCVFTAHKTYRNARGVCMGSYDINADSAVNVSFVDCRQTTDINAGGYWGIFGSNYCRNLLYDGCVFSRFDAHMGVANATIRNCELAYIGTIGFGTFLVENTTVRNGGAFIGLRGDYGSTWRGDFIVRNCTFVPRKGKTASATLVNGSSTDWHDFGYECFMPRRVVFDGLVIDDTGLPENYEGPFVFGMFNPKNTSSDYVEKHPYHVTEEVELRNVTTKSGRPVRLSPNEWMFRNVKVKQL